MAISEMTGVHRRLMSSFTSSNVSSVLCSAMD